MILAARFETGLEAQVGLPELSELSDGQRALIMLYALLHFSIRAGRTVFIDEPDNYLSLAEIEPWLNAAIDALDESDGQLIIVSHHPELIDRLVRRHGVVFTRDGGGPVRVVPYEEDPDASLPPSEEFARGWERA
jgi:ATPase subunit of ABC transporter with duplicated ATPase domains